MELQLLVAFFELHCNSFERAHHCPSGCWCNGGGGVQWYGDCHVGWVVGLH